MGNWPKTSGNSRTLLWNRPNCQPSVGWSGGFMNICDQTAGLGKTAPPTLSSAPIAALTTNTNHVESVPNSCVHVPIRLYSTGRSACASSAANRRIVSAATPVGVYQYVQDREE